MPPTGTGPSTPSTGAVLPYMPREGAAEGASTRYTPPAGTGSSMPFTGANVSHVPPTGEGAREGTLTWEWVALCV